MCPCTLWQPRGAVTPNAALGQLNPPATGPYGCLTMTRLPGLASKEGTGFYGFASKRPLVSWGAALTYCTGQGAEYPSSRAARKGQ